MGSPTIFSGRYTKLLTNKGILNSDGSLNQNDGPINYVKYAEFEQNVTTGWSLGTTGTLTNAIPTGTPTFGSGASGNLSIATSNVSPIRDNFSLRYVSSAATTAGNMLATEALTIDAADQAKVLTYRFYYSVVSGATTANFSGTSSNSFGVAIWDVTNSAWIGVAGNFSMTQNSGVGIASGTFQTNSNTSQIRLVIYNANATSGAITLAFDDFFVGPQTAPIGPVVTDWVSYTPTLTNITIGNGILNGRWRRVGDSIEVDIGITAGSTSTFSASTFTFSVPSGLSIDLGKIAQNSPEGPLGFASIVDAGNQNYGPFNVSYSSSTSVFIRVMRVLGTFPESSGTALQGNPFALGNGDVINVHFSVPISGWSSNVQLSNDTDTRVVAFSAYDGGAVTTTNTTSLLPMGTTEVDTHSVRSGNTYVVPVSGFYRISAKSTSKFSVGNIANNHALLIYKNGSPQNGGDYGNADAANGSGLEFFFLSVNSIFRLNAGDIIDFRYFTNYLGAATTYLKYCSIERLSGPSVVAASESVAMRASVATTTVNSTGNAVIFSSKEYDTHNFYSTSNGVISIPVSGKYSFKVITECVSASSTLLTAGTYLMLYKGSTPAFNTLLANFRFAFTGSSTPVILTGSTTVNAVAGDQFIIYQGKDSQVNNFSLSGSAPANVLVVERVGN